MGITILPGSGLDGAEDTEVGHVILEVGQFQLSLGGDLGL
jgi:hypothetical protein